LSNNLCWRKYNEKIPHIGGLCSSGCNRTGCRMHIVVKSEPNPSTTTASPITTAAKTATSTAGTSSPSAGTSTASPTASPGVQTVVISGFSFQPASLTVQRGASVMWRNDDSVAHRIVSDTNAFSSLNLNQGNTYTHQFSEAGSYPYHCGIHSYMTGTITVV